MMSCRHPVFILPAAFLALAVLAGATANPAAAGNADGPPPSLAELRTRLASGPAETLSRPVIATDARQAAIVEAAQALGTEGGLAWQAHAIAGTLAGRAAELDRIWNFEVLVSRRAGAVIAPPVVRRSTGAVRMAESPDGTPSPAVATARNVWRIVSPARILARVPDWRDFLLRDWPEPDRLPAILHPGTADERALFETALTAGWNDGVALADAIHGEDLDRLTRAWLGMAEWRRLERAGMAVPPELRLERNAVSGGSTALHLDETSLAIAVPGRLNPLTTDWRPLERRGGQETRR